MAFLDKILQDSARYYELFDPSTTTWYGDRGITFNGNSGSVNINNMYYINISNCSNAISFAESDNSYGSQACCNKYKGFLPSGINIKCVVISILSTLSNWASLLVSRFFIGVSSNAVKGIFAGGSTDASKTGVINVIDYIIMSIQSNAQDFGDLTVGRRFLTSCSNASRALIMGGGTVSDEKLNTIDYISYSTSSNSMDFGDLSVGRWNIGSISNLIIGIMAGGQNDSENFFNIIEYITINTNSNTNDFGDLSVGRHSSGGCNNSTRGVFICGWSSGGASNIIDYITISTHSNAIDFGDLLETCRGLVACSGN